LNNFPPRIEQIRGSTGFTILILITLGFYVPYFYDKFIPKLNTMTRAAFGDEYRKTGFAAKGWTAGWCIILSPFVLLIAAVLLNGACRAALFNFDLAAFGAALSAVNIPTLDTIMAAPVLLAAFGGYTAFWLVTVFAMAVYAWRKTYEIKDHILRLIDYYELHEMSVRYEYNLRNLRFYESQGVTTEKFSIEAARVLIEIHNRGYANEGI